MGNVASSFGGQTCPRIIVVIYDVLSLDSARRGVMYQPEAKASLSWVESSASDEVTWVLGVSVGTAVGMGWLQSLPLMSALEEAMLAVVAAMPTNSIVYACPGEPLLLSQ